MNKILAFIFLLLVPVNILLAQEQKAIASLNEVLLLAKEKNTAFKNEVLQLNLANITRKAAIGNVFNPRVPSSIQMIDNVNQQVSFLPGLAFGLPAGTFKEVTIGQQYVSTFNVMPQFDILNFGTITQLKSSKLNKELVVSEQKIAEQKVYDQLNAIYFNILSFEAQKNTVTENVAIAQKIATIVKNKFDEGVARKQELNEAEVNLITLNDKLSQIELNQQVQQKSMALFFENTIDPKLTQNIWDFENEHTALDAKSTLLANNAAIQTKVAQQDLKTAQAQQLPTLGFISSFNWQNLSNEAFFKNNSNWINYSFLGLKLSWDLPTNIQKITLVQTKKQQLQLIKNNAEHAIQEAETKNKLMLLEYEKAISQLQNFKKIEALKEDTYKKNYNQFLENILPLDKLLISQNDMLISKLNTIVALANIGFTKNKIEISNKF